MHGPHLCLAFLAAMLACNCHGQPASALQQQAERLPTWDRLAVQLNDGPAAPRGLVAIHSCLLLSGRLDS